LSVKLLERLCLHDWPGNVRELDLLARQMLALQGVDLRLRRSHLPPHLSEGSIKPDASARDSMPPGSSRRDYERHRLGLALKECKGRVAMAAAKIGISRQRAYRLMSASEIAALNGGADSGGSVGE
jgi:transcriptional regulator of acetoin/glycerol metabolism